MKQSLVVLASLLMCALQGCAVVGGIFKAGVWVGVLAVVIVIIIVLVVVGKSKK